MMRQESMKRDPLVISVVPVLFLFVLSFSLIFDRGSLLAEQTVKVGVLEVIDEDYDGIKLSHPSRLFYDSFRRETYVVDSGNNRILIYAHDFFPLMCIDKAKGIEFPIGLTLDSAGNLFVTQSSSKKHPNGRLSMLSASLKWKKDISFEGFDGADEFVPANIAINRNDFLYVTGRDYMDVVVLDKDGKFSHILSTVDTLSDATVKVRITDIDIDEHGRIYLLSEDMGRVYVYDAQEKFLLKFGQKGGGPGKLSRPKGLSLDGDKKRIYVVDYMRHSVAAYSMEGMHLFEFGGLGWSKGWLQFPSDICTTREGHVLIADTFNNRIQVFRISPIRE